MAKYFCSSIILADAPIVPSPLVSLLKSRCDETILVAADPLRHLDFDGLIVADTPVRHHPFSAIRAGLFAAIHPHALVVDARRPGLKPALLQCLLDAVEPRWDLVIAQPVTGLDPSLAIYSKRCLKSMAQLLDGGTFSPEALYSKLNKHVIAETELQRYDPNGSSFGEIGVLEV